MRRVAKPQAAKSGRSSAKRSRSPRRKQQPEPLSYGPPPPPDCDCPEPFLTCNGNRVLCVRRGSRLDLEPGRILP
jgi:hypothetical protein